MHLSRNGKVLVGLLSILPVVGVFFYILFVLFMVFGDIMAFGQGGRPDIVEPDVFVPSFMIAFVILFIVSLGGLAVHIYLIIHAAKNKSFDDNTRLVWILILVFVNLLANPVYWYLNIWKAEEG